MMQVSQVMLRGGVQGLLESFWKDFHLKDFDVIYNYVEILLGL